jgi:diguanylate cyclase (GGDEF)-like protein
LITALFFFVSGLCLGASLLPQPIHLLLVPAVVFFAAGLWRLKGKKATASMSASPTQTNASHNPRTKQIPIVKRDSEEEEPPAQSPWAAKEDRRRAWNELEEKLDQALLDALTVIRASLDGAFTVALFFPRRDDAWFLRVWISESQHLLPGASIQSHQGLVGKLMKEDVKRVLEGDIVTDSTLLHYYTTHEGIRSMAGVPILVDGVRRGAIVVDSLREKAFDEGVIDKLEALASVVGMLSWQSYQAFDLLSQRTQLHSLASYQRKFLERMSEDHIVANVLRYVQESVEADRYMVLGRDRAQPGEGLVLGCVGEDAQYWEGMRFSLQERGILQIVFEKEQVVNRQFNGIDYVPRLTHKEKANLKLLSLMALPVPTDSGVDMVLSVEAAREGRFSDHHQNLMTSIARAAGFALSRARLYSEKEHLASRDGLTGAINHRTFQESFQKEILRAQRYSHVIAVLLLDIDFFKKVNDTHGHPVGDRVLVEVSGILQQSIRGGVDLVARYGGEEFVCLLVDVTRQEAAESAERIRKSVEAKVFELGHQELRVTLSTGVALFPEDGKNGKDVLERADKALYRAKESGRNRVVFYNP